MKEITQLLCWANIIILTKIRPNWHNKMLLIKRAYTNTQVAPTNNIVCSGVSSVWRTPNLPSPPKLPPHTFSLILLIKRLVYILLFSPIALMLALMGPHSHLNWSNEWYWEARANLFVHKQDSEHICGLTALWWHPPLTVDEDTSTCNSRFNAAFVAKGKRDERGGGGVCFRGHS